MHDFQPMRFDFQEISVAIQFLGWQSPVGKRKAIGGVGFDFFQQCRHDATKLMAGGMRRKKGAKGATRDEAAVLRGTSFPIFIDDGDDQENEGAKTDEINERTNFVLRTGAGEHDLFERKKPEGDSKNGEQTVAGFFPESHEKKSGDAVTDCDRAMEKEVRHKISLCPRSFRTAAAELRRD
jgi:hypothetical protein